MTSTITDAENNCSVSICEHDSKPIEETQRLMNIPGMTESLLKGKEEPFSECVNGDSLEW